MRSKTYTLVTGSEAIDRESRSVVYVKFSCEDGDRTKQRKSQEILTIQVLDENDNGPTFGDSLLKFEVKEGQINRNLIGEIVAADKDTGSNARSFYRLTKSPEADFFQIDSLNGALYGVKP
ncbi:hypothetical protein Ciccas_013925, partial [Cichlidogyrus casuarinus]